jgi:RNA polymerase sigma-70 factor (ECF subfamily)
MIDAGVAGDGDRFAGYLEPHRRELLVHCYRMLGSYEEAEDLVQETFLRAWKHRDRFAGRSSVRTWLYRIATNACLDALDGRTRRVLPDDPEADGTAWLQPFPTRFPAPDDAAVERETIELAFLAAIQHLPPRQRAVLILRDVLGWPAADTAALLDGSVAATNSALQRARETLRTHLPPRRADWAPCTEPTEAEMAVLRRYMNAVERADLTAVAELLAEDVRATMPPVRVWFDRRDEVIAALRGSWDPASPEFVGRLRALLTAANGHPAAALYASRGGEAHTAFALTVFDVADGRITAMTAFHEPRLFPAFGLPMSFPDAGRLPC